MILIQKKLPWYIQSMTFRLTSRPVKEVLEETLKLLWLGKIFVGPNIPRNFEGLQVYVIKDDLSGVEYGFYEVRLVRE